MYVRYSLSKKSETNEDEFPFSARLLSSWDYTLSKPEGAALRTKAIVTNTKVRHRSRSKLFVGVLLLIRVSSYEEEQVEIENE